MATTTTAIRYITRRHLDKPIPDTTIHSTTTTGAIRGTLLFRQSIPNLKHARAVGREHAVLHTVEVSAMYWGYEAAGDKT